MIIDLPDPRDIEAKSSRSQNPIKKAASDLISAMRGDARDNGRFREGDDRDRDRDNDLDDTRSSLRRRYDDLPTQPAPKIQVPFAVVISVIIYLVGQLVTGIWWGATLQSDLRHEIADRAKEEQRLWDSIQTYRSEVNALRIDVARLSGPKKRTQDQEE